MSSYHCCTPATNTCHTANLSNPCNCNTVTYRDTVKSVNTTDTSDRMSSTPYQSQSQEQEQEQEAAEAEHSKADIIHAESIYSPAFQSATQDWRIFKQDQLTSSGSNRSAKTSWDMQDERKEYTPTSTPSLSQGQKNLPLPLPLSLSFSTAPELVSHVMSCRFVTVYTCTYYSDASVYS
jgi:hypothetical protein